MAAMIARTFKILNRKEVEGIEINYHDKGKISDWALESVKALYNEEIMIGYDGYFKPLDDITRAQGIVILRQFMDM